MKIGKRRNGKKRENKEANKKGVIGQKEESKNERNG